MYTSFYQLDSKPFGQSYEPQFYWEGEGQREILSAMQRGLLHNRKFLYLKGAEGAGKTTLIHALTRNLGNDFAWALVEEPSLDRIDFYNDIAEAFGLEQRFTSKVQFLIRFSHFLYRTSEEGKKILLLIDECHQLSQELLEELWLLSNIEKGGTRLLNIYFVGQRLFDELLLKPKNNAVRQRITRNVELLPLDGQETGDYIRHRVKAAGGYDSLFAADAVQAVHRYCRGNINLINELCDNGLLTGSLEEKRSVDQAIIDECAAKLGLGGHSVPDSSLTPVVARDEGKVVAQAAAAARKVAEPAADASVQEEDRGGGWLKYVAGAAALVLVTVGLYLWWPGIKSIDTVPVTAGDDTQESSPGDITAPKTEVVNSGVEVVATEPPEEEEREPSMVAAEGSIKKEMAASQPAGIEASVDKSGTEPGPEEGDVVETEPAKSDGVEVALNTEPDPVNEVVSAWVVEQQGAEPAIEPKKEETLAVDGEAASAGDPDRDAPEQTVTVQQPEQKVESAEAASEEAAIEPAMKIATAAGAEQTAKAVEGEVDGAPVAAQGGAAVELGQEQETKVSEAKAPMEPSKVVLNLQPNSLKLTRGGSRELEKFIAALRDYPEAKVLVKGFVSSKTNSPENMQLSEDRAMSVQKLLMAEGIAEGRIEVKGMGNLEPLASNDTREGRRKNRRVEIVVVDDGT